MIVVTAATGHIGKALVLDLLARKIPVRAVARGAEKLAELKSKGAEARAADVTKQDELSKALAGARAVFTLIPPSYGEPDFRAYQNKVADNFIAAIRRNNVKYVVNLSSIGAELSGGNGPIAGLCDMEQKLNNLDGVNVLHLRPAFFMENIFFSLGLIKNNGINGAPLLADKPFPMVATRDIAARAADALASLSFSGKSVQELLGPRDFTQKEATAAIGKSIGKPELPYVQFPYADAEKAMTGMGMSPDAARLFIEMYKGFNEGAVKSAVGRNAANTTPTTWEEFSKVFAAAYNH